MNESYPLFNESGQQDSGSASNQEPIGGPLSHVPAIANTNLHVGTDSLPSETVLDKTEVAALSHSIGLGTAGLSTGVAVLATSPRGSAQAKRGRRKRRSTNWLFLVPALVFFALYLFYLFGMPILESAFYRWRYPKKPPMLEMRWWERNVLRTCEFLFVSWFFYFGASIGSFLNVVAWRMPLGRTIVFGGSKCPYCNTRLSFIDNTPVIGWLLLRGKCRTCRLPIPSRYLWIEVAVGLAFVWLGLWQLIRAGANLPNWPLTGRGGLSETVFDPNWDLITATIAHSGMFAVLIMLATSNTGRLRFPWYPLLVMSVGLASTKVFVPKLDFVRWSSPFSEGIPLPLGQLGNPILSIVLGILSGLVIGGITSYIVGRKESPNFRWHWSLQCILIGAVLGWQSVVTIVILSLLVQAVVRLFLKTLAPASDGEPKQHPVVLSSCLIGACLIHHSLWRSIAHLLGIA